MSGTIRKVDHIGIAVTDLDAAIELYTTLFGSGPESIEDVPDQKVRTAFFKAGETNIELLYPTADDSPVAKFLAKRGAGVHHICLGVGDVPHALATYKNAGIQLVDETPRIGAHDKRIAFLHPKSTGGVLFEISDAPTVCAQHPRNPHKARGEDG